MRWTWNPDKSRENLLKHGIEFETAQLVFRDPFMTMSEDPFPHEQRWRTLGRVQGNILFVVHTWPEGAERTGRIIAARKATPHERRAYEEGWDENQ